MAALRLSSTEQGAALTFSLAQLQAGRALLLLLLEKRRAARQLIRRTLLQLG